MRNPPFEGIQACVFDAYGTLFDYASAAARCRDALGDKFERLNALWRESSSSTPGCGRFKKRMRTFGR